MSYRRGPSGRVRAGRSSWACCSRTSCSTLRCRPACSRRPSASPRSCAPRRSFIGYVSEPGDDGPGFYQRWVVPLEVIAKPGARLRYLAARALLPSADDREFLRLPLVLYPMYYLLRPVRVALKEGPAALRRLVRSAPPPADHSSR